MSEEGIFGKMTLSNTEKNCPACDGSLVVWWRGRRFFLKTVISMVGVMTSERGERGEREEEREKQR